MAKQMKAHSNYSDPRIPTKQFFRIGEVAKIAEVKTSVLRFWEKNFEKLSPEKSKNNQRVYSRADVQLVLQIKDLLHNSRYTIEGANRLLKDGGHQAKLDLAAVQRSALIRSIRTEVQKIRSICSAFSP